MRRQMLVRVVAFFVAIVPAALGHGQTSRVIVVDARTYQPIPTATLQSSSDGWAVMAGTAAPVAPSAEPGVFVVPHLSPRATLIARASAPGYASARVRYNTDAPAEVEILLPPAVTIGGTVVNPAGEPVADAAVHVISFGGEQTDSDTDGRWSLPVRTDAQGRFRIDDAPDGLHSLMVTVVAPGYAPGSFNSYQHQPGIPMEAYLAGEPRLELRPGIGVSGVVTDAQDNAVEGATIFVGNSHDPQSILNRTTLTDAEGRWTLDALAPAALPRGAVITKPGLAGAAVNLVEGKTAETILSPARTVSGRVVDSAGGAVPGAWVVVEPSDQSRPAIHRTQANAQGEFTLADVPQAGLNLLATAPGYLNGRAVVSAGESAETVIFSLPLAPPAVRVVGTVVDDATGEPIRRFAVIPGTQGDPRQSRSVMRSAAVVARDGRYEVQPRVYGQDPYAVHLRIEADGYEPAWVESIEVAKLGETKIATADVRLRKAERAVAGVVVDAAGAPVAGAVVSLGSPQMPGFVGTRTTLLANRAPFVVTDSQGRFELPSQGKLPFKLIATADVGQGTAADTDRGPDGEFRLRLDQLWGSIAGTYEADGTVAGVSVNAQPSWDGQELRSFVTGPLIAATGPDGRFRIDRVPPGRYSVGFIPAQSMAGESVPSVTVTVESGQTADASVGTSGRSVIGRLVVPQGEKVGRWDVYLQWVGPAVGVPDGVNASDQTIRQFVRQLETAPEFGEWRKQRDQGDTATVSRIEIAADGSFRVSRLPPGVYQFGGQGFEPVADPDQGTGGVVARVGGIVGVESIGDAQIDAEQPVEAGDVPVFVRPSLRLGTPVPPVRGTLLGGGAFDLAAYRGKVVVMDFWLTSSQIFTHRSATLPEVIGRWTSNPDSGIAVIGMNLDRNPEDARKYLEGRNATWPQVHLGDWRPGSTAEQLGVYTIPFTVVLDGEHHVAGINVTDDALPRLVERLLKAPPDGK